MKYTTYKIKREYADEVEILTMLFGSLIDACVWCDLHSSEHERFTLLPDEDKDRGIYD